MIRLVTFVEWTGDGLFSDLWSELGLLRLVTFMG